MTPEQVDRVFGRARLKMVTGEHVEVYREAAAPGGRRRYTKRFLNTLEADFGQWTEREWRILARLIGHGIDCVPEVVQFDRGAMGGTQLVQTYDAGATVDQWGSILPVAREGRVLRHVFEDCAHWWSLAHHCLRALSAIHELSVVHLDIKGDNVCIPVGPPDFDPQGTGLVLYPRFGELALIDFAFALVSRESLTTALPIGWQTEYDYQSPRLLHALEAGRRGDLQPTRELDWRCDMYSLAAMLKRYLPDEDVVYDPRHVTGWNTVRAAAAKELILALREAHDRDIPLRRPHELLMELTAARLAEEGMATSLQAGWTLARDARVTPVAASPLTPITRLAPSIRVIVTPRVIAAPAAATFVPTVIRRRDVPPPPAVVRSRKGAIAAVLVIATVGALAAAAPTLLERFRPPAQTRAEAPSPRSTAAPAASEPAAPAAPAASPAPAPPAPAASPPPATTTPIAPEAPVQERRQEPAPPVPRIAETRVAKPPPASTASRSVTRAKVAAPVASVPASKSSAQVAAARAPARIRFHEEPPFRASEPIVAALPPTQTAPVVATVEPVATPPSSPTVEPRVEPARTTPAPPAPRTPPRSTTPVQPQGLLSMILNLAGLANRPSAPIEERATTPPASARRPSSGAPAPDVARSDAVRVAPPPFDVTYAQKAEPAAVVVESAPPAPILAPQPPITDTPALSREPAPRPVPPAAIPVDYAVEARRALAESIPYSATRAESDVARVLWVAANATSPNQDSSIVDAVRRSWSVRQVATSASGIAPTVARQFGEDARQAFVVRRDVAQAFDLQLRAFGANPRDAEVAGNLAFLYLRVSPPQPELARQVVLHALALGSPHLRTTRVDDWSTLAVASALTGRDADATNALYVVTALTRSLDRSCKAVLSAVDTYGDRLVAPVQAMMLRIRQQGRDSESPYCAWPPRWNSAKGYF